MYGCVSYLRAKMDTFKMVKWLENTENKPKSRANILDIQHLRATSLAVRQS